MPHTFNHPTRYATALIASTAREQVLLAAGSPHDLNHLLMNASSIAVKIAPTATDAQLTDRSVMTVQLQDLGLSLEGALHQELLGGLGLKYEMSSGISTRDGAQESTTVLEAPGLDMEVLVHLCVCCVSKGQCVGSCLVEWWSICFKWCLAIFLVHMELMLRTRLQRKQPQTCQYRMSQLL